MDYLRTAYKTRMVLDPAQPDDPAVVTWYRAPVGAEPYTKLSAFRSRIWAGQLPHPLGLGELVGEPRVYSKGADTCGSDGDAQYNLDIEYVEGIERLKAPLFNSCEVCGTTSLTCSTFEIPNTLLVSTSGGDPCASLDTIGALAYKQPGVPFWICSHDLGDGTFLFLRYGCWVNDLTLSYAVQEDPATVPTSWTFVGFLADEEEAPNYYARFEVPAGQAAPWPCPDVVVLYFEKLP